MNQKLGNLHVLSTADSHLPAMRGCAPAVDLT
jgi:hypothetical protein